MARDRDTRGRPNATPSDNERHGGRQRGRGRTARGGTHAQRAGRGDSANIQRATSSGSHPMKGNPLRASSTGRRHPARMEASSYMHLLPDDIVAQSLLPFLVWHATSALGCVNKSLAGAVRRARDQHTQWQTTTFKGDSVRECLRAMAAQLGRGTIGGLRFAPTFAMATLAFGNRADARLTQSVWSELVDTVVATDVVPVGCVLVGMLDGCGLGASEEEATTVALTISVGHLAKTVVDTAAFDRKALRWSASGLTEEIECPFGEAGGEERTSLLVWSTSAKPAQVLVSLARQWFPAASVAGGVVSRADHVPPLMVFTRALHTSKGRAKRKMKAATSALPGVLSCPSTLLIRLRGKTFIRSLNLCLDRPLTPILKNNALIANELDFTRQGLRTYDSVSIADESRSGSDTDSLDAIVNSGLSQENQDTSQQILNILSSASVDALRRAFPSLRNPTFEDSHPSDYIRSVPLYVDGAGMVTVQDHWEVGYFGIVTVRRDRSSLAMTVDLQIKELLLAAHQASEQTVASVIVCSTDMEEGMCGHVMGPLCQYLSETTRHTVFVDGEVGPLSMLRPTGSPRSHVQTRTVSGFILCHSN